MVYKSVYFQLPLKDDIVIRTSPIDISPNQKTIYDALGFYEDNIFKKCKYHYIKTKIKNDVQLNNIINLHDEDGLDISKIMKMTNKIGDGEHILSSSSLPNIKLIRTEKKEVVVFDGHHTLVSYILNNKKFLYEVPFIMIDRKQGYFTDKNINIFFGSHSKKLKNKNWRDYCINWNLDKGNQLKKRKRKNMQDLTKELKCKMMMF